MQLQSIQVALPRQIHDAFGRNEEDRVWVSGFFKQTLTGPARVGLTNIEGDGQADLQNHGGPDKAILAYSLDHYADWRAFLGIDDFPSGAFGENLSVTGTNETQVCIGDIWQIDNVRLQVSQPRQPCWKLARRWGRKDLPAKVIQNGRSGWYLRVLQEGVIEAPAAIQLTQRPCPEWTVAAVNKIMFHDRDNVEAMRALSECEHVAGSLRLWLKHQAGR